MRNVQILAKGSKFFSIKSFLDFKYAEYMCDEGYMAYEKLTPELLEEIAEETRAYLNVLLDLKLKHIAAEIESSK